LQQSIVASFASSHRSHRSHRRTVRIVAPSHRRTVAPSHRNNRNTSDSIVAAQKIVC
jgi:hypothetical protein